MNEKRIQSVFMVVGVIAVFAYLGIARTSEQPAARHTPSVDGNCVERLNFATNGKVSLKEVQQRCVQ